jgi:hypothetical protein
MLTSGIFRYKSTKLVLLVGSLLLVGLLTAPAEARTVCNHYGNCTICDFYGPNDEYQGYIEWCF